MQFNVGKLFIFSSFLLQNRYLYLQNYLFCYCFIWRKKNLLCCLCPRLSACMSPKIAQKVTKEYLCFLHGAVWRKKQSITFWWQSTL